MAWATVADVKGIIDTVEADAKIITNLSIAQRQIEARVGVQTGVIPDSLSIAHLFLTVVLFLRAMQISGELSYYSKMADTQTYNMIEPEIAQFTKMYNDAMRDYSSGNVSIGVAYVLAKSTPEDA
jgi:hypothetical protein